MKKLSHYAILPDFAIGFYFLGNGLARYLKSVPQEFSTFTIIMLVAVAFVFGAALYKLFYPKSMPIISPSKTMGYTYFFLSVIAAVQIVYNYYEHALLIWPAMLCWAVAALLFVIAGYHFAKQGK